MFGLAVCRAFARLAPARLTPVRLAAAAVLTPVLVSVVTTTARAQVQPGAARVDVFGSVERTRYFDVTGDAPVAPGCANKGTSSNPAVAAGASVTCLLPSGQFGPTAARASGEGLQGQYLKAGASIDGNGGMPFTAGPGGNTLSAVGRADMRDNLTIGGRPAGETVFLSLVVNYDGTLRHQTPFVNGQEASTRAFLGFLANGFTPQDRGWSGWVTAASYLPSSDVETVGNGRFDGTSSRTPDGAGGYTQTLNGRASFERIPVTVGSTFPFFLSLVAETEFRSGDPNAPLVNSLDVNFTSTARIAALYVTDAAGNDLTPSVQYQFASGANYPVGAQVVPEPGTWALLATGLAGVGALARRRRAA